jgi:hypothetical protein
MPAPGVVVTLPKTLRVTTSGQCGNQSPRGGHFLGAGDEIRWWSGVIDPRGPLVPLLFPGGPGKTTSPADFASLMNDLETKIFDRFDDDTIVHPGHGDDTTLGAERPHLAEWRKRGW